MTDPLVLVWWALSPSFALIVIGLAALAAVIIVVAFLEGHRT